VGPHGVRLTPLPASREEAKAVGDVILLGAEATEAGLVAALGARPRWRAVHIAGHGLIAERPQFSSLALTPGGGGDGLLVAHELLDLRVPADLVVLSACETARGRIYEAEGVMGLTRLFMLAGSPRVIVSLWNVDDEATRVLMIRFYELWNPKTPGDVGTSAAAALRRAQEFVRDHPDHPEWTHPFYWAAWQLWGLAD
jgi:CHAT domain-containing protein